MDSAEVELGDNLKINLNLNLNRQESHDNDITFLVRDVLNMCMCAYTTLFVASIKLYSAVYIYADM